MQIRACRGRRTVTSFRLCSRAPWTTSSSAAIGGILAIERTFGSLTEPPDGPEPRAPPCADGGARTCRRSRPGSPLLRVRRENGLRRPRAGENLLVNVEPRATLGETAKRAFVATLVAGSVIVVGLALWKIRLIVSLLFLGLVIAA